MRVTRGDTVKFLTEHVCRDHQLVKEAGYGKAYSTTQGNDDPFSLYRAYI